MDCGLRRKKRCRPDFLVGEYRKTPLFTQKEVDSIISLIKAIFDYATLKNIVLPEEKAVFNDIKRFLSDNLERDLTVDSICERFFLSKRQLYKLFKNNTGKTVMQYGMTVMMSPSQGT